jgi:hypothetical protein
MTIIDGNTPLARVRSEGNLRPSKLGSLNPRTTMQVTSLFQKCAKGNYAIENEVRQARISNRECS